MSIKLKDKKTIRLIKKRVKMLKKMQPINEAIHARVSEEVKVPWAAIDANTMTVQTVAEARQEHCDKMVSMLGKGRVIRIPEENDMVDALVMAVSANDFKNKLN